MKQMGFTINFANPNSVFFTVIFILILYIISTHIQS
ncbi:hypothetical protein LPB88_11045 [Flavobacterium sp. JAS]|nr:hypothetical protein [Flavobacterium sp. JAS]